MMTEPLLELHIPMPMVYLSLVQDLFHWRTASTLREEI